VRARLPVTVLEPVQDHGERVSCRIRRQLRHGRDCVHQQPVQGHGTVRGLHHGQQRSHRERVPLQVYSLASPSARATMRPSRSTGRRALWHRAARARTAASDVDVDECKSNHLPERRQVHALSCGKQDRAPLVLACVRRRLRGRLPSGEHQHSSPRKNGASTHRSRSRLGHISAHQSLGSWTACASTCAASSTRHSAR
jgi:hypothetical protein